MKTKITILEHFQNVKDSKLRLRLLDRLHPNEANKPVKNLADAIWSGFIWGEDEGWKEVVKNASNGKIKLKNPDL